MLDFLRIVAYKTRPGKPLQRFRASNLPIGKGSIMANHRICSIDICGKKAIARGFCDKHYRRNKSHGSAEIVKKTPNGTGAQWIDGYALRYTGDDCLKWPFGSDKDGYPRCSYPGYETRRAHRIVCWIKNGPPPSHDYDAGHSCGKGHEGCINPNHLSWRSKLENSTDKIGHGTTLRGERGSFKKLDWAKVDQIRSLSKTMPQSEIAKMFGVAQTNISMIVRGATWKEEWKV